MSHHAFIALGSNIGDRAGYLEQGIALLADHKDIELIKRSSIYETEPVGYVEQQSFLNMVIKVQTSLYPSELLAVTQSIELQCGRKRDIRWGPRTIDLDILLFDQENMEVENLTIPHPRMWERAFVIVPLMELEPNLYVEQRGQSLQEVYDELPDKEGVLLWNPQVMENASELTESSKDIRKKVSQKR
ncbi:2-amino-4-hydroxy-6-hydroxymethyldihydropteridine diphosphokinase [Halalkalibacter nanhaiisediminis]|uniref:2-amino-4-hydroxy-6-hydroxymethyldihydropteridine diphosphokinase n=1 Tax=Halalkalibacter nanhaiisediminis TaxID=688079 RepID=A0A562QAK5_9BACI|nr:2-amino-4-hydroxy-6-hydroxymethyldihydropteridine diphosphokinase [Halalkalibacter nanhaiisediminis]TWI53200.1 2-amino-4-hydroxy-6-hydroxymethyldihydropteridine diphosphokinase [Halalkalibacter nanhaiisediminis]